MGNSETPITPGERDVLEQLETYVETTADTQPLTREMALTYLTEQDFERPEASDRIEQLLLKGYLYEVDEELRIPPQS